MPLNTPHHAEYLLFFTLLQITVIIVAARLAGHLARRAGQPRAVGEILAGLMLGPSLLGSLGPETFRWLFKSTDAAPIHIMSQIGLIMLMFQIGLEFDFAQLRDRQNRKAVWWITLAGMIVPFGLGLGFGFGSAVSLAPGIDRLGYSLFMATAMAITAVPILGRIMLEYGLVRTRIGIITITSAAINDAIGWMVLAVVAAIVTARFSWAETLIRLGWLMLYVAASWLVARKILLVIVRRFKPAGPAPSTESIKAITLDGEQNPCPSFNSIDLRSSPPAREGRKKAKLPDFSTNSSDVITAPGPHPNPSPVEEGLNSIVLPPALPQDLMAILLVIVFGSAMLTSQLGIFAIFGGFMVGVLLHDQHELVTQWRAKVADLVTVLFLPIFFTFTGLRTDIGHLATGELWLWCGLLIGLAVLGKFGGCYAAARFAGLSALESRAVGIMMNTRALMELIVANLGYDLGVIPPEVFTMLVLMAIFSTVMTAPGLRIWLPAMGYAIPPGRDN